MLCATLNTESSERENQTRFEAIVVSIAESMPADAVSFGPDPNFDPVVSRYNEAA